MFYTSGQAFFQGGNEMAMKLPFLRKRESSSFHCHPCEACARESGEQESSPIWTRVFLISGFPPAREQAWFPACAGTSLVSRSPLSRGQAARE